MDSDGLIRLVPAPIETVRLEGLYLDGALARRADGGPLIYAAYVASLDGRIAMEDASTVSGTRVPPAIANPRDWRLFQELVVQADALVVSGRLIREVAAGDAQSIADFAENPEMADLVRWRRARNLPPRPALIVLTNRAEIDIAAARSISDDVTVATSERATTAAVARLEGQGARVVRAGEDRVPGARIVELCAERGHGRVFVGSGPDVLHTFLDEGLVDELFLTTVAQLLGGEHYVTLLEATLRDGTIDARLRALYLEEAPTHQLFARYELGAPGRRSV